MVRINVAKMLLVLTLHQNWYGITKVSGFCCGIKDITGGVLTFTSYEKDFRYASYGHGGSATSKLLRLDYFQMLIGASGVSSLAVGLQQLGGFVGCFVVWPMTNALGRRKSLMVSSVTFCIGAIIQTINTHSLPAFYVARVIAGLGLGSATVVVPMFTSEMAPKEIRGTLGGMFQWMYTWGTDTLDEIAISKKC